MTSLYGADTKDFKFGGDSDEGLVSQGTSALKEIARKYDEFSLVDTIPIGKIEKNIDKAYDSWDGILTLWERFIVADIMVHILGVLLFIFFLLLSFIFKNNIISKTFLLLSLISYPIVLSILSDRINDFARTSKIENLQIKQFQYSADVYIRGDLVNKGRYDFTNCLITITIYKKTDKLPKDFVNKIKPLAVREIKIDNLKKDEYREFFITMFEVPKDVNFTTNISNICK